MHCLLCHEKIPRLRAWTGKSEFCCDEHAELYKKQTMDRLLVDDSQSKTAAPTLPIFDAAASSVDHILLKGQPKKAKRAKEARQTAEVDELWKLAERMGGLEETSPPDLLLKGGSSEKRGCVETQSGEEALAALQALAAEAVHGKQSDSDLLAEFSRIESSLEGLPQLDSLPIDLADEMGSSELNEAPELELDALEPPESAVETCMAPDSLAQAAAMDAIDAPDLVLEGLLEAQAETLEPPELAAEFEPGPVASLEPPEFAADFDREPIGSLEPPDAGLEELLALPSDSDELSNPPEPADFEPAAADAGVPAFAPAARRAPAAPPKVAPKLRPAVELQEMSPSPTLPEGRYALKPWTDALAVAGPDRSSLLGPTKSLELRKSSLNGTASAKFDPVQFRGSERIARVPFRIPEPKISAVSCEGQDEALTPTSAFAWPAPLHAVLVAAEMRLNRTSNGVPAGESFLAVKQPTLSAEFLSRVALQSRILEPRRSAILSPLERDGFTSAAAGEEESGSGYASAAGRSDRDETDGGERAHVADLF